MAGLAAARVLARHGLRVTLYEATDRIGGRVQTIDADHALPVELGPEFVHGDPPATLELAQAAGLAVEPIADTHHLVRDGRLIESPDVWRRMGGMLEPAAQLRADESAGAYLADHPMADDDGRLFAMMVEGFYAAPLDDISIIGVAEDAGGAGDDSAQHRIRGGYGQLVQWLAAELAQHRVAIEHGVAVDRIDWRRDRVELTAGDRAMLADAAIVTVPLAVLASDAIRFDPDLGDHRAALGRLAMGQVVKLVLCLDHLDGLGAPLPTEVGPEALAFVHADAAAFPTFWIRSRGGAHQITLWAGGPHAIALARFGLDELVDRAVDEIAGALGLARATLAAAIEHAHHRDYAHDPFARGAYSYTRVGGMGATELLARAPGPRLVIAGEATDTDYEGSVAGALASGIRAANQVLAHH